MAALCPRY